MLKKLPEALRTNLLWTQGRHMLWVIVISLIAPCFVALSIAYYFSLPHKPLFLSSIAIMWFVQMVFFLYFYRNPSRIKAHYDPSYIVSPADGRVMRIETIDDRGFSKRIVIFLSPFDVHVQWTPMDGVVQDIHYKRGTFTPAFLHKSEHNERNEIVLENNFGTIAVRQMAGFLTRRITCWIKRGDKLSYGQKYGMIHFSSRVDVLVPDNVHITVHKGQRVRGSITQLGRWQCSV